MRGKAEMSENRGFIVGITPAYAGKSDVSRMSFPMYEDHPRLCGEKISSLDKAFGLLGSPPPMRGKAWSGFHFISPFRITPAYAGKRDTQSGM